MTYTPPTINELADRVRDMINFYHNNPWGLKVCRHCGFMSGWDPQMRIYFHPEYKQCSCIDKNGNGRVNNNNIDSDKTYALKTMIRLRQDIEFPLKKLSIDR